MHDEMQLTGSLTCKAALACWPASASLSLHATQVIQVVCCRLTEMQLNVYKQFVKSTAMQRLMVDADLGQKKTASRILTVGPAWT